MSTRPAREAWQARAYRIALRAFPTEFRKRWADDMWLAFLDRMTDQRRATGRVPLGTTLRELSNLLASGFRERLHSTSRPAEMFHLQDIRYAFRLLTRSPGFALLTVLVLAGGIGLSTFTFSFLYTAMIRAVPLAEGDRIVRLTQMDRDRRTPVDLVDVDLLRSSMRTVRELGGYTQREVILGREGDRRVLSATVADPVLFKVGRTPALLGRALLPSDAEPGAAPVIVLSYRTWEAAFAGERSVLDTQVAVNGVSTRIVGVMPDGFGLPVTQEAWLPLPATASAGVRPGSDYLTLFGRLAPGATHDQAAAEATALIQGALTARDTSAQSGPRFAVAVESFPAAQIGEERTLVFTILNLLAALILLLALVNVTTLLTARANERNRETAVRLALGASTGRLVMQGMWEGIILCLIAGVIGTTGAGWGLSTITRWTQANMQGNMSFWWVWRLDHVAVLAAGVFVTAAIAVLGSVVSLRATRTNVREVMQDGSARSGSRREGRLARGLVATQVTAVTILMFVGVISGVVAQRVAHMDPGYDPTNVLQVSLDPPADRFPTTDARAAVFRGVATRLANQDAIADVLLRARLARSTDNRGAFAIRDAHGSLPNANILATLGALSTLGMKVVEGRSLAPSDDPSRAPVALVSRSLATRHWHGRSPVGDQIRLATVGDTVQWRTIVGVVSDNPYGDPLARDRGTDAIYLPLLQAAPPGTEVFVRSRGDEVAGRQALHQVFGEVDPLLVPGFVFRASEVIQKSGLVVTGLTKLFGGCFVFALLLAVAGTYGLMSRSIGLRTREIGVRRALGATDAVATRMLLTQGARQLGVGTIVAAPILAAGGAAATHFLPLSGALTTVVAILVSVAIVAVVLAATWVPTRKVLRVALRDALWRE